MLKCCEILKPDTRPKINQTDVIGVNGDIRLYVAGKYICKLIRFARSLVPLPVKFANDQ